MDQVQEIVQSLNTLYSGTITLTMMHNIILVI